jgi:signal peptidase II
MEPTPSKKWFSTSLMIMLMVVIVDQVSKVIVLKTMYKGQSIPVFGDWLRLTFTENPGMAFGIQFGPPAMITILSLAATLLIIAYLYKVGGMYKPYRYSLSFVLGGAFGNIIDRVFYGKVLFDDPLFLGKVVDFIHVNVWRGVVPEGIPFLGGKYLALFPIWNVADMAIVLGVVGILFFQRQFHELAEKQLIGEPIESDEVSAVEGGSTEETTVEPEREADLPGQPSSEG